MLYNFFYGLFIIACIIMVATVLLQPGKSDAGALFTSNISSTAFGPRGTQSVLARITIGAATAFMLLAFLLAQPALTGNRSVLDTVVDPVETPAPTASPNANANVGASPATATEQQSAATNSNTAVVVNSNATVAPSTNNSNK